MAGHITTTQEPGGFHGDEHSLHASFFSLSFSLLLFPFPKFHSKAHKPVSRYVQGGLLFFFFYVCFICLGAVGSPEYFIIAHSDLELL
jgi:hypothetical protein